MVVQMVGLHSPNSRCAKQHVDGMMQHAELHASGIFHRVAMNNYCAILRGKNCATKLTLLYFVKEFRKHTLGKM